VAFGHSIDRTKLHQLNEPHDRRTPKTPKMMKGDITSAPY